MEAIAKFDFKATADDELSFGKGNIVKVRTGNIGDCWHVMMASGLHFKSNDVSSIFDHVRF